MGALETVGAGIAGIAAARMILGSPRAATGMAIASTATTANAIKPVATVAAAAVGGAALGGLAGVAALAGSDDRNGGFDYGLDDRREQIGWGAALITAATIGAVASSSSIPARIAGGVLTASFVAAGAAVTNFTRDEMPRPAPTPTPEADPAAAAPTPRAFEHNRDLNGAVVGKVGYQYDAAYEYSGRATRFDGLPLSEQSFGSRDAALKFVDSREKQLAKGAALVHPSFDVKGNWSVTYLDDQGAGYTKNKPPKFWELDAAGLPVKSDSILVHRDGTRIESE